MNGMFYGSIVMTAGKCEEQGIIYQRNNPITS